MLWLLFFSYSFGIVQGLEVIPQKPEIEYTNPKYIKQFKFTIHRKGRGSPYYINMVVESLYDCGNNITVTMNLFEYMGGNYSPIGIQGEYKLCDFFENEPYLGKMFDSQLVQQNMTCPWKAGLYQINDILFKLEDFPFNIPFTWSSISVRTRCDVTAYITHTKESVLSYKFHFIINQKPKNKN